MSRASPPRRTSRGTLDNRLGLENETLSRLSRRLVLLPPPLLRSLILLRHCLRSYRPNSRPRIRQRFRIHQAREADCVDVVRASRRPCFRREPRTASQKLEPREETSALQWRPAVCWYGCPRADAPSLVFGDFLTACRIHSAAPSFPTRKGCPARTTVLHSASGASNGRNQD